MVINLDVTLINCWFINDHISVRISQFTLYRVIVSHPKLRYIET